MGAVLALPDTEFAYYRTAHLLLTFAPSLFAELPANEHDAVIAGVLDGFVRRRGIRAQAIGVSNAEEVCLPRSLGRGQIQGECNSMPIPPDHARYSAAAGRPARRHHTKTQT